MTVNCKSSDDYHLSKLRDALECEYKLITVEKSNEKYNFSSKITELKVNSEIVASNLIDLGVLPNKTGNECMPNINNTLKKHFIRGFFDGDGSITSGKTFRIASASLDILTSINSYFEDNLGISLKIYCSN